MEGNLGGLKEIRVRDVYINKPFMSPSLEGCLRDMHKEGFEPVFVPEFINYRINSTEELDVLWQAVFITPSLFVTKKQKNGKGVAIYAHVPNYLSQPDNWKHLDFTEDNGAVIPNEEFERLLSLQDNKNVFAVDYDLLRYAPSGRMFVRDALKHPQTVPYCTSQEIAEKYFKKYSEVFQTNKLNIICAQGEPSDAAVARFLIVGHPGIFIAPMDMVQDFAVFMGKKRTDDKSSVN